MFSSILLTLLNVSKFSGGQFRKETILPNGTVVGAYSWRDRAGRSRVYTYTADSRGYRVTTHHLDTAAALETAPSPALGNHLDHEDTEDEDVARPAPAPARIEFDIDNGRAEDRDARPLRKPKKLRRRRKVLVKRPRSGKGVAAGGAQLVRRLGAGAATIPYQPSLELSRQYPGRPGEVRLVGEGGIITLHTPSRGSERGGQSVEFLKCDIDTAMNMAPLLDIEIACK